MSFSFDNKEKVFLELFEITKYLPYPPREKYAITSYEDIELIEKELKGTLILV